MRPIDADTMKNYMAEKYVMYDHTFDDIDAQPTIDAVPVVRCAECISFDTEGDGFGICQLHKMTRREEHFCSDGKRSEDGTTSRSNID